MTEPAKPPVQSLSLDGAGINAHVPMQQSADAYPPRLPGLPPFQQFLREKGFVRPPFDDDERAAVMFLDTIKKEPGRVGAIINDYADWHKAKGKWPNETPFGDVKP